MPVLTVSLFKRNWGYRDGSVGKSTGLMFQAQLSNPTGRFTNMCDSFQGIPHPLLTPKEPRHMHVVHRHEGRQHTDVHKIECKIRLKTERGA